eukprot:g80955.t1
MKLGNIGFTTKGVASFVYVCDALLWFQSGCLTAPTSSVIRLTFGDWICSHGLRMQHYDVGLGTWYPSINQDGKDSTSTLCFLAKQDR